MSLIGCGDRLVGALCLVKILLALLILAEDFRPWWSDEYGPVVAEILHGFLEMGGHGYIHKAQISCDVRNAAIKENGAGAEFSQTVRAHVAAEHEFRKQQRIAPRQCAPVNSHLILNDFTSGFNSAVIALSAQGFDQGCLARSRPASNDVKAICANVIHNIRCANSSKAVGKI